MKIVFLALIVLIISPIEAAKELEYTENMQLTPYECIQGCEGIRDYLFQLCLTICKWNTENPNDKETQQE